MKHWLTDNHTVTANAIDAAGNAATQISSSQFAVDKSTPSCNFTATAFSWGSELSATDDDNLFGTVTVLENGQRRHCIEQLLHCK